MKRILPILLIIVCLTLGGCSPEKTEFVIHGREQVKALRTEAAGWHSGRYLFTDLDTGVTDQAFSFMYAPDGAQICLYEQVNDGNYYAEYNDGKMMYIIDSENISIINEGNMEYVSYSRENPHPYSTGELLFYVEEYINYSEEVPLEDNAVTYVYGYDTASMNQAIGKTLTSFSTSYTFDSEGNFLYFTQSNSDGANTYAYMIEAVDINGVTEIENPTSSW